jgi:hypothetical protein
MQFLRQGFTILVALLLAVPGWGASSAIGTVQESTEAVVRGTPLVPGTRIFSDDRIAVGERGGAMITLAGGGQIQLLENTEVQIRRASAAQGLQIAIDRGITRFRGTERTPIEAVLADATIRTANGPAGGGYVSVVSPTSAVIGAEKGALLVTTEHDGSTITVPEGSAVTVRTAPEDDSKHTTVKKRRAALIIILGAIIVGGAAAAAIAANQSSRSQDKGALSPFKP